nr:MAG TPA: hypothetical protein [Caudoviricetes sp.]
MKNSILTSKNFILSIVRQDANIFVTLHQVQ